MIKSIAFLAVATLFTLQAPAMADDVTIARPLQARLIAAPTYAAFADASRLVAPKPQAVADSAGVTAARPLHARLIAAPTYAAFADASRLVVRKNAEFAMLPR
jgi:hypothetical protein